MAPWQTYMIPNDRISNVLRSHLAAAAMSETLDPWRICECCFAQAADSTHEKHAPPDMSAKAVACYLLDAGVATIREKQLLQLLVKYRQRGILSEPGRWQRYRESADRGSSGDDVADQRTVTDSYKFKMFYV